MRRSRATRPSVFVAAVTSAIIVAALGCARTHMQMMEDGSGKKIPVNCKDSVEITQKTPIPLTQSVKYLHKNFPGCLTSIADSEGLLVKLPTGTSTAVNCVGNAAQTNVLAAQTTGGGGIDSSKYGDDGGRQRGFVLAAYENTGDCATAGPVSIPAHSTVLWVIDRRKDDKVWHGHLVIAGTDAYLDGYEDWKIGMCHHPGYQNGDKAMLRTAVDPCDHSYDSPGGPGPLVRATSLPVFDTDALWMICGGDCCYTNSI